MKDLEVLACHGVNPEEKVVPQRFVVSIEVFADISAAAESDDVKDTVSYSAVKKLATSFVTQNIFDLIETLAARLAAEILKNFRLASGVCVEIKKPDAPMSGKFDYVAVKTELKWHKIYLSLGSNMGDRDEHLDAAVRALSGDTAFKNVRESARMVTQPYGGVASGEFLNSVVEADTYLSPERLLDKLHAVEREEGRVRDVRWGDRTLDIDIIFYDDIVYDKNGLSIPHYDMINREFVLKPLSELAPYKVHPLLGKSVCELLADLKKRG